MSSPVSMPLHYPDTVYLTIDENSNTAVLSTSPTSGLLNFAVHYNPSDGRVSTPELTPNHPYYQFPPLYHFERAHLSFNRFMQFQPDQCGLRAALIAHAPEETPATWREGTIRNHSAYKTLLTQIHPLWFDKRYGLIAPQADPLTFGTLYLRPEAYPDAKDCAHEDHWVLAQVGVDGTLACVAWKDRLGLEHLTELALANEIETALTLRALTKNSEDLRTLKECHFNHDHVRDTIAARKEYPASTLLPAVINQAIRKALHLTTHIYPELVTITSYINLDRYGQLRASIEKPNPFAAITVTPTSGFYALDELVSQLRRRLAPISNVHLLRGSQMLTGTPLLVITDAPHLVLRFPAAFYLDAQQPITSFASSSELDAKRP